MPEIIHDVIVAAPPQQVRQALITQDGLAAFWTDQATAEPAVGSQAWFGFGSNAEHQIAFDVTEIDDTAVAWTCTKGADEWIGTRVNWILTPTGDGRTRVRFEHLGWASTDGQLGECSYTWGQILARLAAYVGDGTVAPYFRKAS